MQFHGIGGEEHSAQAHHVTKCMHDHSHYKMESEISKGTASSAKAQAAQPAQSQPEGQLSLAAWMERSLSKGKSLLRSIWGSNELSSVGEAGDRAGQAQVLAQLGESREADGRGRNATGHENRQPDEAQAVQASRISQAAAAVPGPRVEEAVMPRTGENGGQEENLLRRIRVRFKDIAGHLTGHLRREAFSPRTKSSLEMKQERPKEERRKPARQKRDAVEIDSYRMEESYLLDSYDSRGGYRKLSTKK